MSDFGDAISAAIAQLMERPDSRDNLQRATRDLLEKLSARCVLKAPIALEELRHSHDEFMKRNESRWYEGFEALETLTAVCVEAGSSFQQEFLAHVELQNDILLGVLMRIHARSCRTAREITALMRNGYADAALARWRTLHELAVTAQALSKLGRPAAMDYLAASNVKALEGMREYQQSASWMGMEPYTDAEMVRAELRVDRMLAAQGRTAGDYGGNFGWARPYVHSGHFDKLQQFVGMDHWNHEYKWASQDVHAGHRASRAPLAMSEASQALLLVGASDSGMTEPGDRTAISLSQVTTTFLGTYVEDDVSPLNCSIPVFWITLIEQLLHRVGPAFLQGEKPDRMRRSQVRQGSDG